MSCKYKINNQVFNSKEELKEYFSQRKNITKDIIATFGGNTSTTITPFKSTDQWVGLATRRILKLAVDEGYSGVALATGQQSADMYSLSNQVDKIDISFDGMPEGQRAVYIAMKNNSDDMVFINNEGVITESKSGVYTGKKSEDVLGKELTKKILETTENTTLEGEGLEFGGEGMKTFYDKIVPKVVQKEAQRLDKNAKVETVDFSEQPLRVTTDEEGNRILVDYVGEVVDAQYGSRFTTDQEYIDAFKDAYNNSKGITVNKEDKLSLRVQPYIAITDKMKSELSQGIPQFQKSLNNVGINLITNGFTVKEYPTNSKILDILIAKNIIEKVC